MNDTQDLTDELIEEIMKIDIRQINLGNKNITSNITLICANRYTDSEIFENLYLDEIGLRRKIYNYRKKIKGRNTFKAGCILCPDKLNNKIKHDIPMRVIYKSEINEVTNYDLIFTRFIPNYFRGILNKNEKKYRNYVLQYSKEYDLKLDLELNCLFE